MFQEKTNPLIYRILYFSIFTGDALFSPFYSLYFLKIGMSDAEESILLALVPFSLFLGDWIFSYFATSFRKNLWLMRGLALFEAIAFFVFGITRNFVALLVMTVLVSFFNSAYFQIQDASCVVAMRHVNKKYESVRIFGSIAYAVALLSGYFILSIISYQILFSIAAAFFLIGFVLTFLITLVNEEPYASEAKTEKTGHSLLSNRVFVFFLLFYGLFFGAANWEGYVIPIYLSRLGLQDNEYSFWSGIRVVMEISCLLLFPIIFRKLKTHKNSLIAGALGFFLSAIIACFVQEKYALVSLSFIARGFANGFVIISSVVFLHDLVGDQKVARALTLAAGLSNAVSGVGNLVSSYIYTHWSFQILFLIVFGLESIGLVFLFLTKPNSQKVVAY